MKNKNFYATQVKKRTQINKERRTNVASRWEVVEILRSTHAIFPLGTRLIQSTKHKSARKKGDLNRVGMRKNERDKRSCVLPDLSERPGNTAWGGRLTMWEVLGSSRSLSYPKKRSTEKVSHADVRPLFYTKGIGLPANKRDAPKTAPRITRHLGHPPARSRASASESQCSLGHQERKTDLRNDRFWVDNSGHLANIMSLIAHRHKPLRLLRVHLESGARNTQK